MNAIALDGACQTSNAISALADGSARLDFVQFDPFNRLLLRVHPDQGNLTLEFENLPPIPMLIHVWSTR